MDFLCNANHIRCQLQPGWLTVLLLDVPALILRSIKPRWLSSSDAKIYVNSFIPKSQDDRHFTHDKLHFTQNEIHLFLVVITLLVEVVVNQ